MELEALLPSSYFWNMNLFMEDNKSNTEWTKEENKEFERALAIYDEKTPDRWAKVASRIPGKSAYDVMMQYMELEADVSDIEAGLVPIPGYLTSSFTLEGREFDAFRKRPFGGRPIPSDQERKKGIPWTEEEHRLFLMGLQKHGKGDWRSISRNFVVTKTPTQVASHAQKYFIRQSSGVKDKRRPSIHDITTVHLNNTTTTTTTTPGSNNISSDDDPLSPDKTSLLPAAENNPIITPQMLLNFGPRVGPLDSLFQFQSTQYQIYG